MPMSPRLLRPLARSGDSDVRAYIAAVEAADQQALEQGVKDAIRDFITGCKADGIWTAIKASCLLMGARTLSGALTPLVGAAPTNANFVSGDYSRSLGLQGNGTNKSLDSNRAGNADPEQDVHLGVLVTAAHTAGGERMHLGFQIVGNGPGTTHLANIRSRLRDGNANPAVANDNGFCAASRSGNIISHITGSVVRTFSASTNGISSVNYRVFGQANAPTNSRIAFYSIGTSLDVALLNTRVTALYNAIGAAIP